MSTLNEEDHLDPNNPMYYAPRRTRDEVKSTSSESDDAVPALPRRNLPAPSSFDTLLKEARSRSLRHPLDPEAVREPAGLSQWMELLPVAARFAVAIGVAALVALFFVFMIPASRDHAQSSASGVLEALKTGLSIPTSRESSAKPATPELQAVRAAQPAEPALTHEQSETLLHQFERWQQKQDSTDSSSQ
jgi:hypothetical protein